MSKTQAAPQELELDGPGGCPGSLLESVWSRCEPSRSWSLAVGPGGGATVAVGPGGGAVGPGRTLHQPSSPAKFTNKKILTAPHHDPQGPPACAATSLLKRQGAFSSHTHCPHRSFSLRWAPSESPVCPPFPAIPNSFRPARCDTKRAVPGRHPGV